MIEIEELNKKINSGGKEHNKFVKESRERYGSRLNYMEADGNSDLADINTLRTQVKEEKQNNKKKKCRGNLRTIKHHYKSQY